ncbi:MAG: VCBS repeat-containing protein [Polyangiaceae bacterium]|nr:VCBS repeat-containing protein [Polyangiaceae bacterium]
MKKLLTSILALSCVVSVAKESQAGLLDGIANRFCDTFPWLCRDNHADNVGGGITFRRWTVADGVVGAAYNSLADVDGDGLTDIIVTTFGEKVAMAGEIQIYYNNGTGFLGEDNWQREKVVPWHKEYLCFPNEVSAEDIDGDGDVDLFAPSGFIPCAANPIYLGKWGLAWYEQTCSEWKRHEIVPYKNDDLHDFFHKAIFVDVDQDGIKDLVTVGEMKNTSGDVWAKTMWFKGNGSIDRFEKDARVIGQGGGGLPVIYDIDQDGDIDVFSAQYFGYLADKALGKTPASFVWFEMVELPTLTNPNGQWEKHVISTRCGPSIQFALVKNLLGDGKLGAIGANHTNIDMNPEWVKEALYSFEIPENFAQPSPQTVVSDAFDSRNIKNHGSPDVIAHGDIDRNGLIDIAVSGDGEPAIYLVKQTRPGEFETFVLDDGNVGQAGISMGDLNGDGMLEIIVSTYDGGAVYAYEAVR